MDNLDLKDVLTHSLAAGREAAKMLKENFGKTSTYQVSLKQDNSLVTQLDRASQSLLIGYLKKQFPQIPFIAEEQDIEVNARIDKEGYYFVIDPLDGTATFVSGIPFFCVSVALCRGNKTISGVIVDPNHNEEFSATLKGGAFLNGNRIHVSEKNRLEELYLNVNHTKFGQETFDNVSRNVLKKIKRFHKLGSLCLEVSYVAAGRLDGTINNELSMWDIAAAGLILEEAGGRWTLLDGSKPVFPIFEKIDICGTNALIHNEILEKIAGKR